MAGTDHIQKNIHPSTPSKFLASRNGSRELIGNSCESLDTASSGSKKKIESQATDGFEIPEEEIWCYNPSKMKHTKVPCYFRDWIREVFDSYDSPLYNLKGQIFHLLGTSPGKTSNNQDNQEIKTCMTLSQSESVPSLNKIKESSTFDGKLSIQRNSSRGHSHSPPIHLSSDEGDLCRLAKKQEDALKAQVAAMSLLRHTESQSSLKSANTSPKGSKTSLNTSLSLIKDRNSDRYMNAMEDSEIMLNRIRHPISANRQSGSGYGGNQNLGRSYNQPLRINPKSNSIGQNR